MINDKSISAVNASVWGEKGSWRKPLYDSYCFSNIPGTIEKLLTGKSDFGVLPEDVLVEPKKKYQNVVLFFVDAFGWRFFERYRDQYPALQRFIDAGTVSKITSQFPSTTAAHVTAIHTGQAPGESGVYEWHYYEPQLDAMIAPLLYSYARDHERGTLSATGVLPDQLYPNETLFKKLTKKGVASHLFQPADFTPSPYNDHITMGVSSTHPYTDFTAGLTELATLLATANEPTYAYYYFNQIDTAGHDYGTTTPEFDQATAKFFTAFEQFLTEVERTGTGNTLLLMTADHGQTDMNPETTFLIDRAVPDILPFLETNQAGELLIPAGSHRDLFLHVKSEHLATVHQRLAAALAGVAEVHRVDDLIKQSFFGPQISDTFLARAGNVVVLPYAGESVYWCDNGAFVKKFYGHHGGLTPHEMESIFLALEV